MSTLEAQVPALREIAESSNAWPFQEARKIVARLKRHPKDEVVFETGYGPSGLPHIGTFGEVARTTMVRHAFRVLTEDKIKTRLIAFSDDMDGLRKVPDNVPNREMMARYLGKPLSRVPDPFSSEYPSFAAANNARLRAFLDQFGFEYEFLSSTECYTSGRFDAALLKVLERFDTVMEIMLPSLREERAHRVAGVLQPLPRARHCPVARRPPGRSLGLRPFLFGLADGRPTLGKPCRAPVPLLSAQEILQLPAEHVLVFHRDLPPAGLNRANWLEHAALVSRQGLPVPAVGSPGRPTLPELAETGIGGGGQLKPSCRRGSWARSRDRRIATAISSRWILSQSATHGTVRKEIDDDGFGAANRSLDAVPWPRSPSSPAGSLAASGREPTPEFRSAWGPFPSAALGPGG